MKSPTLHYINIISGELSHRRHIRVAFGGLEYRRCRLTDDTASVSEASMTGQMISPDVSGYSWKYIRQASGEAVERN